MRHEEIQPILMEALEQEIPSSQINLWPAVKQSLSAGTHQQTQQGAEMNIPRARRVTRVALAIWLFLALAVVLIATPQGRSFAESVLELFTRVESTAPPVVDSRSIPGELDPAAPTALPPAPLISIAEAEVQVGFNIAELPSVPEGFEFLGARLYGNNVSMDYMTAGYGHLLVTQSREGFYESEWDRVPEESVVSVKIGEQEAELVQGTFIRLPGESSATWNPNASFTRLRWVDDGIWIEIALHGDAHQYLDMEQLIQLAESLANES